MVYNEKRIAKLDFAMYSGDYSAFHVEMFWDFSCKRPKESSERADGLNGQNKQIVVGYECEHLNLVVVCLKKNRLSAALT